jgi:hypothetical protein
VKARIACLAIALFSTLLSGCTVIGIVAGASADRRNAREHRVSWDGARSVPRGRKVEVALTSGDTLRGKFTGLRALPADSYRIAYDSVRALLAGDSVLPRIGETVCVISPKGRSASGSFRGLEAEALTIRRADDNSSAYFPLSRAAQLRNLDGQSFDVDYLRFLASSRALPSTREFMVQSGGQTYRVPLEHIQQVYAPPHPTHYWILGGVVGLALDAALVAAYCSTLSWDYGWGWSDGGGGYYQGGY